MTFRYKICRVMQFAWTSEPHRQAFARISDQDDVFVPFANGILNHTNSLIADALPRLPDIRRVQQVRQDADALRAMSEVRSAARVAPCAARPGEALTRGRVRRVSGRTWTRSRRRTSGR